MSEETMMVVIPLPLEQGSGVTYGLARLVEVDGEPFAEATMAVPNTIFAPPRRIRLSRYGLTRVRPGTVGRPELYVYEGMILPPG